MINFCTLFDSNYLAYGLSLYKSLQKHCPNFHLYIFAFDEKVESDLCKLSLANVTIILLSDFEDEKLLSIKPTRNKVEYCWTCTPSVILYVLKNFKVASCTYIDSDLYFFSDPTNLVNNLGEKSVSVIQHRYTAEYDQTQTSGKYCVQFMTFKNDEKALNVLQWWRERCIEWCFGKYEDGKFGDQKYLDDWMTRFDCITELQDIGAGVAPWNVQQYKFYKKFGKVFGIEQNTQKKFPLIFYHFHGFKVIDQGIRLTNFYKISYNIRSLIYLPYIQMMLSHKIYNLRICNNFIFKIRVRFVSCSIENLISNQYFTKMSK